MHKYVEQQTDISLSLPLLSLSKINKLKHLNYNHSFHLSIFIPLCFILFCFNCCYLGMWLLLNSLFSINEMTDSPFLIPFDWTSILAVEQLFPDIFDTVTLRIRKLARA